MKKIMINEGDIRRMVAESVKRVLREWDDDEGAWENYCARWDAYNDNCPKATIVFDDDILPVLERDYANKYPIYDEYGDINQEWYQKLGSEIGRDEWTIYYNYYSEDSSWDYPGCFEITDVSDDDGIYDDLGNVSDEELRKDLYTIVDDLIEGKKYSAAQG